MSEWPIRSRRVLPRGVAVPEWWDPGSHDLSIVTLKDGRKVAITGMEACQAKATTPEALLRLAQEIAYDEEYPR